MLIRVPINHHNPVIERLDAILTADKNAARIGAVICSVKIEEEKQREGAKIA